MFKQPQNAIAKTALDAIRKIQEEQIGYIRKAREPILQRLAELQAQLDELNQAIALIEGKAPVQPEPVAKSQEDESKIKRKSKVEMEQVRANLKERILKGAITIKQADLYKAFPGVNPNTLSRLVQELAHQKIIRVEPIDKYNRMRGLQIIRI